MPENDHNYGHYIKGVLAGMAGAIDGAYIMRSTYKRTAPFASLALMLIGVAASSCTTLHHAWGQNNVRMPDAANQSLVFDCKTKVPAIDTILRNQDLLPINQNGDFGYCLSAINTSSYPSMQAQGIVVVWLKNSPLYCGNDSCGVYFVKRDQKGGFADISLPTAIVTASTDHPISYAFNNDGLVVTMNYNADCTANPEDCQTNQGGFDNTPSISYVYNPAKAVTFQHLKR